ncbi:WD repeat and HMG-box DNA-binding protein 1 [Pseudolycoriella hygida]|uniref:WD repeat and HMG-box DNA-binding protein 1 n=1 Tax=Pseudolycoriella hygida TaxID=35572 RepID=A0A9Q0S5S6_9DIPT|nr:WD repeat and HMG-box DNA-binding protein 1 [Pseudolycoriella hygida]
MPFKRSLMRYAHSAGHTHCCYTADGERIITSGSDGDIRIWQGIDDDDPNSECIGEFVLCIAHYGDRLLASTDLNTVQAYTYPERNRDGTEFTFTAPVTTIKVDSKFIAAGSEDTVIKVVPVDKSEEFFELTGHEGPILKIDTSPKGLLASSSGDGTIRIWDLKERKEIKVIKGFETASSFYNAKTFVTPSFEPTKGSHLAYVQGKQVQVLETVNWSKTVTLKDDKISSNYTVCSFSPCGKYIAAGTQTAEISVWEVRSGDVIKGETKASEAHRITALDWNPANNGEFAYTDNTGQLGTIIDCYNIDENILEIGIDENGSVDNDVDFGDIQFDKDDEDNENCISLERLKNETLGLAKSDDDDLLERKSNRSDSVAEVRIPNTSTAMQSAFQSSSTPAHLEHRYMVWNNVGIVKAHTDGDESTIGVEFHDASVHHDIHISNYLNHTMAALSSSVLALACDTPSKLVCIALSAGSREWSISLPDCEEIIAIGASEKLVAIATDVNNLRVFSVMGTQRELICLPGPVVAVAGHGDSIMAAFHAGSPINGYQNISIMLMQAIGLSVRCREFRIGLTPCTKLTWLGFSDRGSPVCNDTMGTVRMYNLKGNYWTIVCDMNKHIKNASDTFFIVDVSEHNQIVRAILCRGGAYPMTTPKPLVTELPMQIPLCDMESDKSELEESLLRNASLLIDNSEANLREIAIKLFAIACRSENEVRAKELVEMIASPNLLSIAIKYANKLGRIHLSAKLTELLPQMEEQEQLKEKRCNEIEMEAINLLQSSPMNASLMLAQKDKSSSLTIAPKPILSSQGKRNPFKRGGGGAAKLISNPLSHLTDKAIGFNDSQSQGSESLNGLHPLENDETINNENIENESQNLVSTTTPPKFMDWYKEHKEELQSQNPDAIAAELTKIAMRQFKALQSATKSIKRRAEDDEGAANKLTKYN